LEHWRTIVKFELEIGMKHHWKWIPALAVALTTFGTTPAVSAADVSVLCGVRVTQSDGETALAEVTVTVTNLSSGDLRNVNATLIGPTVAQNVRGPVQIGTVVFEAAAVGTGSVVVPQSVADKTEAMWWRVDYDDPSGEHHEETVAALGVE
jgi:hypothetical protein